MNNTEKMLKENLNLLIANLKQGHTASFEEYLKFCSHFHKYSFNNRFLIKIQKPFATKVASYQSWKKLGRYVKEGEKGIKILVPITYKITDKETNEEEVRVRGYKEGTVFDISQTDGKPIPSECTLIAGDDFKSQYYLISEIMKENNILVEETDLGESLDLRGISFGGKVQINQFLSYNHKLKTLIHEFAHEILHKGSESEAYSRSLKEFEAESTAFIVCGMLGLEANTSKDYILNWIDCEEFNEQNFTKSLNRVLDTSSQIFNLISNKLEHEVQDNNQEDLLMAA